MDNHDSRLALVRWIWLFMIWDQDLLVNRPDPYQRCIKSRSCYMTVRNLGEEFDFCDIFLPKRRDGSAMSAGLCSGPGPGCLNIQRPELGAAQSWHGRGRASGHQALSGSVRHGDCDCSRMSRNTGSWVTSSSLSSQEGPSHLLVIDDRGTSLLISPHGQQSLRQQGKMIIDSSSY